MQLEKISLYIIIIVYRKQIKLIIADQINCVHSIIMGIELARLVLVFQGMLKLHDNL